MSCDVHTSTGQMIICMCPRFQPFGQVISSDRVADMCGYRRFASTDLCI